MLSNSRGEKEAGDLLSTYLLQGWIMTDEICNQDGCSFPLMRSKDGSLSFCTHHDDLPNGSAKDNYKKAEEKKEEEDELQLRRDRREQSSKASQLIGQKMLQRWALLNEHCPNSSCYAVPLVRNPDTKQMFCVICENIILTEAEAAEMKNKQKAQNLKPETTFTQQKIVDQPQAVEKTVEKKADMIEAIEERKNRVRQSFEEPMVKKPRQEYISDATVSILSKKLTELTEQVELTDDPKELTVLFKSIKACANSIKACVAAMQ